MIVTSFALRSPCSWQLQCEMYVLQFYLNLFSVVLAQLRSTLRCRRIYVCTPSPLYMFIFTRSHLQIYLSTSPRLHIYITSVHPHCHSFTSVLSFVLSTYLFSLVSVHLHLGTLTSTDLPVHLHTSTHSISHLHIHTVTPSRPPFLSIFLYIFSTVLDNHMSRSRATGRLVSKMLGLALHQHSGTLKHNEQQSHARTHCNSILRIWPSNWPHIA